MEDYYQKFSRQFFKDLEGGMEGLTEEQRAKLFRPCAISCVKNYVLAELQRQYHECNDDLDQQYTKYNRSEFFFADIIEKGHVYEIGYPKCTCPMVAMGFAESAIHCECSLQSIKYVYEQLIPDKKVKIEAIKTILSGGDECRFRITIVD